MLPIAGPIVDRFDRRKVMLIANFFGAVLSLSFLLVRDSSLIWLLYLNIMLLISSATFFGPAAQAVVPSIVSEEELISANALSSSTWGIMVMVGSAVGGIASQFLGRDTIFVINSASFLLANLLIWQIKLPSIIAKPAGPRPSTWTDFGEGIKYVRRNLQVLALVAVKSGWGFGGGVIVLLSVFSDQVFKAGDAGIGILYAGRGLGALLGPILVRKVVGSSVERSRRIIGYAIVVSGFGYFLFALSAGIGIWFGFLALVVAHAGGGTMWVLSSVLMQKRVPDGYRGRVFSLDMGMNTLANSISTIIFGLALGGQASPVILAVIGGFIFIAYGILWSAATRSGTYAISE
jgi:MFS family permease